jgi:RNA polymerase sporulation-specific sigma factor
MHLNRCTLQAFNKLYSFFTELEGGIYMKKIIFKITFYWNKLLIKLGLKADEVFYIGGSEALPPPLSKEEEEILINKLPCGDETARTMLIERNLRLVVYIARKFENTGINIEDLISIGTIGLIKAVNTFNPEKKIKLATYASRCIENEILMYLRRNNKIRSEVSFDEPLNIDWDGNELLLSDVLGTEDDIITKDLEANVDKKLLTKALHQLSVREKQIMELRFGLLGGEEKTQKDVADMLGISQSYISRLEKRIIKRLRKEFNKMV